MLTRTDNIKPVGFREVIFKTVNIFGNAIGRPLKTIYSDKNVRQNVAMYTNLSTITINSGIVQPKMASDVEGRLQDRLDHILSHIVFRTDLLLLENLADKVAERLKQKHLDIKLTKNALSSALFRLLLSYEDSRVAYQWALRYPGSSERTRTAKLMKILTDSRGEELIKPYESVDENYVTGSILGTTRRFKHTIQRLTKNKNLWNEINNIYTSDVMNLVHNDLVIPISSDNMQDRMDSQKLASKAFDEDGDEEIEKEYADSVKQAFDIIQASMASGDGNAALTGYFERVIDHRNEPNVSTMDPDPELSAIFRNIRRRKVPSNDYTGTVVDIGCAINSRASGVYGPIFPSDYNKTGADITILIDKSRSMCGEPFALAHEAAETICTSAKSAGIDISVLSFTSMNASELLIEDYGSGMKNSDQSFGSTPLHAAVDYVSRKMSQGIRKKRALIILSDGSPNFMNSDMIEVNRKAVVEDMRQNIMKMRSSGIMVHAGVIENSHEDVESLVKNFEGACPVNVLQKSTIKENLITLAIAIANSL
jgi:hypothetical protein